MMGAAKGGDAAAVELAVLANFLKKIAVLGIGARPAALDIMDPELRQLPGDADLVGQGQGEIFRLGAVPQGGVVDLYLAHSRPSWGSKFKVQSSKFKVQSLVLWNLNP